MLARPRRARAPTAGSREADSIEGKEERPKKK
jgi:hypothetical protein